MKLEVQSKRSDSRKAFPGRMPEELITDVCNDSFVLLSF